MMRHQSLIKERCCLLFSYLRVLLRLTTASSALEAPTDSLKMNGLEVQCQANGVPSTNSKPTGLTASPTAGALGPDKDQGASGPTEVFSKQSEERLSLSDDETPMCRICFEGPEEGEMLSPCRCSGSVRCTHQSCLNRWIGTKGVWSCEICNYKYQVSSISLKNPLQWQAISMSRQEKVQTFSVLLSIILIIASFSWFIWSSISPSLEEQRKDVGFRICYGFYAFLDIICIGLIIREGPSVLRLFHRWQAVNLHWKVLNYEDKDSENRRTGTNTRSQIPTSYASVTSMTPGAVLVNMPSQESSARTSLADNRCSCYIFRLFSNLRHQEPRGQPNNREMVTRV